jgi:hypothetical protein
LRSKEPINGKSSRNVIPGHPDDVRLSAFRIEITGTRPVMTWETAGSRALAFPAQINYSPRFAFAPAGG